jgi:hypothetical protein
MDIRKAVERIAVASHMTRACKELDENQREK